MVTPGPGIVSIVISSQTKKASAAFVGAVVLASGAYAVGSTSGDGEATANQSYQAPQGAPPGPYVMGGPPAPGQMRRQFRHDRLEMFSGLAKELGVKEADLRKAMREIRKEQRDLFVKKLADKLGVPEAKVKKALPDRPKMTRRFHGPPPAGAPQAPAPPPPGAP